MRCLLNLKTNTIFEFLNPKLVSVPIFRLIWLCLTNSHFSWIINEISVNLFSFRFRDYHFWIYCLILPTGTDFHTLVTVAGVGGNLEENLFSDAPLFLLPGSKRGSKCHFPKEDFRGLLICVSRHQKDSKNLKIMKYKIFSGLAY